MSERKPHRRRKEAQAPLTTRAMPTSSRSSFWATLTSERAAFFSAIYKTYLLRPSPPLERTIKVRKPIGRMSLFSLHLRRFTPLPPALSPSFACIYIPSSLIHAFPFRSIELHYLRNPPRSLYRSRAFLCPPMPLFVAHPVIFLFPSDRIITVDNTKIKLQVCHLPQLVKVVCQSGRTFTWPSFLPSSLFAPLCLEYLNYLDTFLTHYPLQVLRHGRRRTLQTNYSLSLQYCCVRA